MDKTMDKTTKLINKEALLAEIERLDNFYHAYKSAGCGAILDTLRSFIEKNETKVEKFERPNVEIKDTVEVSSRLPHIDKELLPIAEFIMDYCSWNLHKDEWNQPTIEVPLFRVLDALVQKGKPYCCAC